MTRPVRRNQFRTADFFGWLASNGAEAGMPTNPYEVCRYRAYWHGSKRAVTHVVYAKENGLLTFTCGSGDHYDAFLAGAAMNPQSPRAEAPTDPWSRSADHVTKAEKTRRKLLARDGDACWFCGDPLGADATIEHLIPKAKGGTNSLVNYALAHKQCNAEAADKPLTEKIAMRERARASKVSA